jgi:hypothetical protein
MKNYRTKIGKSVDEKRRIIHKSDLVKVAIQSSADKLVIIPILALYIDLIKPQAQLQVKR